MLVERPATNVCNRHYTGKRAPLVPHAFMKLPVGPVTDTVPGIIGSSDHLVSELPTLLDFGRRGLLDLSSVITRTVPLQADAVNAALDDLERFGESVRTVIVP